MRIIVTGSAGFIGASLCNRLLRLGQTVVGIDNHNDYYDPELKQARVNQLTERENYQHYRVDISDQKAVTDIFGKVAPDTVVNLAAQAGVRYSISNPETYISSNIVGFANVLESCRQFKVEHLVYASSSSVYGGNRLMPFSVSHNVDHPLSLYAASKKSNELMAHSYSNLFSLPTTGLRFFTVYGPWGRPDMAIYKFTEAILNETPIQVFNHGNHVRDFTYIDDIVDGIVSVIKAPPKLNPDWDPVRSDPSTSHAPWRVCNIGSGRPVKLMDCIRLLEDVLGKRGTYEYLPLQDGDVTDTHADVGLLQEEFGFSPRFTIREGIEKFVQWYLAYRDADA